VLAVFSARSTSQAVIVESQREQLYCKIGQ
jgi:hypothetical protein